MKAELAERSPIIIQNISNPSSQKNLDVRLYNRRTVQGATFNMRGQLYYRHANATALSSSSVVSALGSALDEQRLSLRLLRDNSLLPITIHLRTSSPGRNMTAQSIVASFFLHF